VLHQFLCDSSNYPTNNVAGKKIQIKILGQSPKDMDQWR